MLGVRWAPVYKTLDVQDACRFFTNLPCLSAEFVNNFRRKSEAGLQVTCDTCIRAWTGLASQNNTCSIRRTLALTRAASRPETVLRLDRILSPLLIRRGIRFIFNQQKAWIGLNLPITGLETDSVTTPVAVVVVICCSSFVVLCDHENLNHENYV